MVRKVGSGLASPSIWTALLFLVVSGCATVSGGGNPAGAAPPDPGGGTIQEPDENPSGGGDTTDSAGDASSDVPDLADPFLKAISIPLEGPVVTVEGRIAGGDDLDIYAVGPLFADDRLVVDVQGALGLDAVAAVFDGEENLIYANDDRAYYAQLLDPKIDVRLRRDCDRCYVAVASSFGSGSTGDYVLSLSVSSGGPPPEPSPQLVYFNFDGAEGVRIGNRPPVDIPSFEGSLIAPEFAGRTDELIEQILALVRADYIGLNVEFVSSRESADLASAHSTVHFGAYDPDLLGVADNIDEYNAQPVQQAVIFVDTFQAFLPLEPSVEEMAQAIANVAAHETGHLLGLQHTHDPRGLMDISANLRQLMGPQAFLRSPLDVLVFPIGYQDSARLLVEAVGGDLALVKTASLQQIASRVRWYDERTGPAARETHRFSTCCRSRRVQK